MYLSPTPSLCGFPPVVSTSPEMTESIGRAIASAARPGTLILMYGDLGAGKTLLASSIGASLGARGMRSPTFTIESRHELTNGCLVHIDLYRLEDASDEAMHIAEMLDDGDIVIVEWADRFTSPPSDDRIMIHISCDGESRSLTFRTCGGETTERFARAWCEVLDICR